MKKKKQVQRKRQRISPNILKREIMVTALPLVLNAQAATLLSKFLINYRCLLLRLVQGSGGDRRGGG